MSTFSFRPTEPSSGQASSAETIAKSLGGSRAGRGWSSCCPAHDDATPSLSIRDAKDGKILVYCHAGCDQKDVSSALQDRGLWNTNAPRRKFGSPRKHGSEKSSQTPGDGYKSQAALILWQSTKPAEGSLVETYLATRGLHLPPTAAIRFHASIKHHTGSVWPAMIGLVTRGVDASPLAIHRTFLAQDGTAKAPVDPPKMMLGPCSGGVVRLGDPIDVLMVGEGIETCLAVMNDTGIPAWAALSTSGLRSLDLPSDVRDVIVLADGDDPGEAAARDCAVRWKREGRRVRIARPPRGTDFNDVRMESLSRTQEGA